MSPETSVLGCCSKSRCLGHECTALLQSSHFQLAQSRIIKIQSKSHTSRVLSSSSENNQGKSFFMTQRKGQRYCATNVRCDTGRVNVRLRLDHQVQFGEQHALMGSSQSMGSWQNRTPMEWTESGWVANLEVNARERVEFKYLIVLGNGDVVWEDGSNRVLEAVSEGSLEIVSSWNDTNGTVILQKDKEAASASMDGHEARNVQPTEIMEDSMVNDKDNFDASTSFVQEWQGKNISFMRSNEHSNDVKREWNTSGLQGPALELVEGDKKANNWWRKLEVVQNILTGDLGKTNRLDALISVSIYLKWINTGQIPCFEDGGHHRPNRHAEIARLIFRELERMSSQKILSSQELVVIRKLHPCLPSFKAEFTASVPLTRIRDIAHRNDIPHDLKQEIKHTIQNKLHRNAGPEDLVATELLLSRVTKQPGEYSAAFVEQLKIFYNELKDFFNAGSLTEQLESIKASLEDFNESILEEFLARKKSLDELGEFSSNGDVGKGTDYLISTMHSLTSLRAVLTKGLESGIRNDAPDDAIAMRQKWRLCEIGLEDYAFVLLSRFVNIVNTMGGSAMLATEAQSRNTRSWSHPLGAVVLGIRQLGISGWKQAECMAIENEILAWEALGMAETEGTEDGTRIWALRFKATLERARRLCEVYSDMLLQMYPKAVQELGRALGIPENTVRCYTEAEIRASVVFQLSKLCSLLLKALREVANEEGWDPIVSGVATGTLVEVDRITPGSLASFAGEPIILLVKEADGDEEVKASGENVTGVILLQELPHLSHLGVRARQEKVVFVTCEDEDKIASLRSLLKRSVRLEASANAVHVMAHEGELVKQKQLAAAGRLFHDKEGENTEGRTRAPIQPTAPSATPVRQSKVLPSPSGTVLDLIDVDVLRAGAKASSCGLLAKFSVEAKSVCSDQGVPAGFSVPAGKVIPFGAMEAALQSSGDFGQYCDLLDRAEAAQIEHGKLDRLCEELQDIVAAQRLPPAVIDAILESMPTDARLIVRSSANVEDLEGMSGAGLYESIPNVRASEPEHFGKAVAQVWASLYTRRAILSRRVAGVPQREAAMAVLVQELLSPHISFVLHTVSPVDRDEKLVEAEMASGLGETLASGTRGSPWRVAGNKFDATVQTKAFANFSEELVILERGVADGSVKTKTVDYSTKPLSTDSDFRRNIAQQLTTVGFFLEQKFGAPQDVEGCIVGKDIYIVQARPQPL